MGSATNQIIMTLRQTGKGSDHFGACDQCGKSCSHHFVATSRRVYRREDGTNYLGSGGGAYGHEECLKLNFGPMVQESDLQRKNSILEIGDQTVLRFGRQITTTTTS
jgi:hypothetical protein